MLNRTLKLAAAAGRTRRSIDTIVLTWTLCSIPNPIQALREMRRVLRADGQVVFAEHGLSPDPGVQVWQRRLNPIWRRIAGGCNMNRKIDDLLLAGGFKMAELTTSCFPGPKDLDLHLCRRSEQL